MPKLNQCKVYLWIFFRGMGGFRKKRQNNLKQKNQFNKYYKFPKDLLNVIKSNKFVRNNFYTAKSFLYTQKCSKLCPLIYMHSSIYWV